MLDDIVIPIECPYCRRGFHETIAWLRRHDGRCPVCHMAINQQGFSKDVKEVEVAIVKLRDAILRFGKSADSAPVRMK